jgi:hypothetical protein
MLPERASSAATYLDLGRRAAGPAALAPARATLAPIGVSPPGAAALLRFAIDCLSAPLVLLACAAWSGAPLSAAWSMR